MSAVPRACSISAGGDAHIFCLATRSWALHVSRAEEPHLVHYMVHYMVHYIVQYMVHYTVHYMAHHMVHYMAHHIVHYMVHHMVHHMVHYVGSADSSSAIAVAAHRGQQRPRAVRSCAHQVGCERSSHYVMPTWRLHYVMPQVGGGRSSHTAVAHRDKVLIIGGKLATLKGRKELGSHRPATVGGEGCNRRRGCNLRRGGLQPYEGLQP